VAAAALVALGGWWRGRNVGAVLRGQRVAAESGCFGCHGPGGVTGLDDPGRGVGGVPPLVAEDLRDYAESAEEVEEWIRHGLPRRLQAELEQSPNEPEPLLRMPAFGDRLSNREIAALTAWLSAVAGFGAPGSGPAAEGLRAADRLGCFGCHGPGGRGDTPNPGSLKGYVPAWNGRDFPELVRSQTELREWILDGSPARLRGNAVARWFLERQALRMPAYRDRLAASELEAVVAYIAWLRGDGDVAGTALPD